MKEQSHAFSKTKRNYAFRLVRGSCGFLKLRDVIARRAIHLEMECHNTGIMRWAIFGLHLVRTLVWPVVVLVFRPQIIILLGRITRASAGGVSVEFQRDAEQAKTQLQSMRLENLFLKTPADRSLLHALRQSESEIDVESSYVGQVIRAWARIETLAVGLAEQMNLASVSNRGVRAIDLRRVVDELQQRGFIAPEAVKIVGNLQRMRNRLAHDPDVIGVSAAEALLSAIRELEVTLKAISDQFTS